MIHCLISLGGVHKGRVFNVGKKDWFGLDLHNNVEIKP